MSERNGTADNFVGRLSSADMERVAAIRTRLGATSFTEAVRRAVITFNVLLEHQEGGGQIVLCKKGLPDKVVWFV